MSIDMARFRFLVIGFLFLFLCSACFADFFPDYQDENPLPNRNERIRRFIKVMSRKPEPDAVAERGIGFRGHLRNILSGGTLRLEFQIPERFRKRFRSWGDALGPGGNEDQKEFEMVGRGEPDYKNVINPRVKVDDDP